MKILIDLKYFSQYDIYHNIFFYYKKEIYEDTNYCKIDCL
jgi:hypothetical protein